MGQVKFGLSNIHYAKYDTKTGEFAAPVAVPGARSLTTEYEGDTSSFYADNTTYFSTINSSSITGELEIADTPEQMRIDLLGDVKDAATGMLLEDMGANSSQFALMGEIDGDPLKRRFVYYNCKLSRPNSEANTKEDTVEPDTDTYSFTAISLPLPVLGETRNISRAVVTSDAPGYADFFDEVKLPTAVKA